MNKEEIDYWLKSFSNNNQSFMSKDGKIITLFKVFQELKELQRLLKIQNDYINELEVYKYNMDRDYLRLEKENKKLKEVIDKAIKLIEDTYYSKNTTGIDSIVLSSDKLIKIRKILKEVNKWI